ncbi:MAG: hypothetical protein E5Y02_00730 [Mesorhizobium sp.]|nr:MAG: hypothetical protein E5Y02_00730 [Mesorhizobium sp.]
MAHYLVRARIRDHDALRARIRSGSIASLMPFGAEMQACLENLHSLGDGWVTWEEQCFCVPPLKQERAVLDLYFSDIKTVGVQKGNGWEKIKALPRYFDESFSER